MKAVLSGKEMKEFDARSIRGYGIPSLVLMERAAMAVAEKAEEILERERAGTVWSVCGFGNNGADGVAAARMLFLKGYDWKLTVKRTLIMAYAAIVPILLACPVIIPSIKALSGGKVSDFVFFTDRKKPMTNYIWAFACAISGNFNFDQSPVLFAGVLEFCFAVMFLVGLLVFSHKKK